MAYTYFVSSIAPLEQVGENTPLNFSGQDKSVSRLV